MKRGRAPTPPNPTVPDFAWAPELAPIIIVERALDVVVDALLAEHQILIDDFRKPGESGRVISLASTICRRAALLRETLAAYRRAVRDAAAPSELSDIEDDLPF